MPKVLLNFLIVPISIFYVNEVTKMVSSGIMSIDVLNPHPHHMHTLTDQKCVGLV